MTYKGEMVNAMELLAEDERVIFIGQTILYPGNVIYGTLEGIPTARKIEIPLFEDTQLGMSIGLSLEGYMPVSIYPRMDFLIIAANQLVNHLDKIEKISCGQFRPKVIIRTMVGATKPLYPGLQHCSDYTEVLTKLLTNVDIYKLDNANNILPSYQRALASDRSSILIEIGDLYG